MFCCLTKPSRPLAPMEGNFGRKSSKQHHNVLGGGLSKISQLITKVGGGSADALKIYHNMSVIPNNN